MIGIFRPNLFLAGFGAIAFGLWMALAGPGDAFGFPFDLPEWMLVAGKRVAVGAIAILAGLAIVTIAALLRPTKYEKENPPSTSQLEPGD